MKLAIVRQRYDASGSAERFVAVPGTNSAKLERDMTDFGIVRFHWRGASGSCAMARVTRSS